MDSKTADVSRKMYDIFSIFVFGFFYTLGKKNYDLDIQMRLNFSNENGYN